MLLIVGWLLFSISSTFFDVMPNSSASIMPIKVHFTRSNHWSSPWRTIGPSGSLEMRSGRIVCSPLPASCPARTAARPEASVV